PAMGGDSIRVATRLPGVSSVGVSARPRIRGGLQDELLVLVDGVELLDPFHLADFQSIFSTIDDRTVDAIDVYTGGFPARYGNRMSGVMEISTPEQANKPGTELGLSMFSALVNTRGKTESGDTTWLASGRRGNLDLLTNRINSRSGHPRYFDAYGRVGHRLNDKAELFLGGFFARDDVTLKDDEERAESDIDSRYTWLRLDLDHAPALKSASVLTYVWSNRDKEQLSPDEEQDSVGFLDYTQRTRKYSGRTDWSYSFAEHLMEFGAQLEYEKSAYDSSALIDRGDLSGLIGQSPIESFDIHEHPDGWSGGVYWSGEFAVTDALTVLPGLRWDFQDFYHHHGYTDQISPRLGLKYALLHNLHLRLDAGRYYQPEGVHEMQASDGVDRFYKPQRAEHFIAAIEWSPLPTWDVRVEAYRKQYGRTKARFENIFNPFVLLPELEPDRVLIAPTRARASGYDIETSRLFSDVMSASLRYSYMDADDRINGTWVSRRWSQQHTVNAVASWQFETFSVSAALTWHSCWRTSRPPNTLPADEEIALEDLLNNKELKGYFSFDLSASKAWQVGKSRITTYADVTNVFNMDNAAGVDYDIDEQNDGSYVFLQDDETLLPVIVSVGVLVSF
ncbi:MAG: TonB-dependent receptor, partial [Gammaproteobacteria bacterium]